jgi:hypothetical protein
LEFWTCQPEWSGETCFIVGGGASVCNIDLRLIEGRRIITVNSAVFSVPFADFQVFADPHWWWHYWPQLKGFKGRIVAATPSKLDGRVLNMRKMKPPPGLTLDRQALVCHYTSVQAAINLAFHLGAERIVLLGVDNGPAQDGTLYHHRPHPSHWNRAPDCWDRQRDNLALTCKPLKRAGIEVINASPTSRLDLWPKKTFEECL